MSVLVWTYVAVVLAYGIRDLVGASGHDARPGRIRYRL